MNEHSSTNSPKDFPADLTKDLKAIKKEGTEQEAAEHEKDPAVIRERQLETIDAASELPIFLAGGYAEDAVIEGEVTRDHHDVDLIAKRQDIDIVEQGFLAKGYEVKRVQGPNGSPYKLLLTKDGLDTDVALLDLDEAGVPFIDIKNNDLDSYRVFIDEEMFDGEEQTLQGKKVKVVSPLALFQMRQAVIDTGRFEPRPHDITQQAKLLEKFFKGSDEESLKPRIERITSV